MEAAVTGGTTFRLLVFLLLLIFVHGWWKPIRLHPCPSANHDTNECFHMRRTEMNCTEVVLHTCPNMNPLIKMQMNISMYPSGPCQNQHLRTCVNYVCDRKCCDGYYRNSDGTCTPELKTCFNGGTPKNNVCICPEGFTGRQCQIVLCDPPCQNGGVCSKLAGIHKCYCPANLTGDVCEKPKCGGKCMNGGVCVLNNTAAICLCRAGYTGEYCQTAENVKQCLDTDIIRNGHHRPMCHSGYDCKEGERCCKKNGDQFCARRKYTCSTKDGGLVGAGMAYHNMDTCETCICSEPVIADSTAGSLRCATVGCSSSFLNNSKCCPVSGGQRPCGYPVITNCPKSGAVIAVDIYPHSNTGCLSQRFHAKDCLGNPLETVLKQPCFQARQNYNYVTETLETSADFNGNKGRCTLVMKLIDSTPPVFISCPPNVYAFTDERVIWKAPEATDNVGVRSVYLVSNEFKNGSVFSIPGIYILYYYAVDWQGNTRSCSFKVYAINRDSSIIPPEMNTRKSDDAGVIIAASVVGILAIILVLLVVIMFRVCRLRNKRLRRARQNRQRGHSDNDRSSIYSVYTNEPPPYDIAARDKLPGYSPKPKGSPPTYDDIAQEAPGAHSNPVYDRAPSSSDEHIPSSTNSRIQIAV